MIVNKIVPGSLVDLYSPPILPAATGEGLSEENARLKEILEATMDQLDQAELAIKEFLEWNDKSPQKVPAYAIAGLTEVIENE